MKVLHVIRVGGYGGAEKLLLQVLPAMKKQAEVECIICYPESAPVAATDIKTRLEANGLKIHFVAYKGAINNALLKQLASIINKGSFDIVHSHLKHADFWLAILKITRRISVPVVSTMHSYTDRYENKHGFNVSPRIYLTAYYRITKIIYSRFQGFIMISEVVSRFFRDINLLAKNKRQQVIYHGYEKQDGPPPTRISQNLKIVVPGRLILRKGHSYMIDAFRKIKDAESVAELHFYGSGPEEANLRSMVKGLDLEDSIFFHGYVDDLLSELKKADIVVIPSLWEAFGVVFLDAFAAGVPVVAFDLAAGNEIVKNGHNGLLAKPYSSDSLCEQILLLHKNPELRLRLLQNAWEDLNVRFSLGSMIDSYMTFYEAVINDGKKN